MELMVPHMHNYLLLFSLSYLGQMVNNREVLLRKDSWEDFCYAKDKE